MTQNADSGGTSSPLPRELDGPVRGAPEGGGSSPTADTETLIDPVSPESARGNLEAERDLLLARQDALVRYLGRAEFLRAIGEADPCEVIEL